MSTHVVGAIVRIKAEISETEGSIVKLKSLHDPLGNLVLSDEPMGIDTTDPDVDNVYFYIWQSIMGTHPVGQYKYILELVNGSFTDKAKGMFFLEEE